MYNKASLLIGMKGDENISLNELKEIASNSPIFKYNLEFKLKCYSKRRMDKYNEGFPDKIYCLELKNNKLFLNNIDKEINEFSDMLTKNEKIEDVMTVPTTPEYFFKNTDKYNQIY